MFTSINWAVHRYCGHTDVKTLSILSTLNALSTEYQETHKQWTLFFILFTYEKKRALNELNKEKEM